MRCEEGSGAVRRFHAPDTDEHNLRQRKYFERSVKRTMVPRDSPYLRRHVDETLQFGGISPGERVLEVGCGMGRCTFLLAGRGVRVEGLDLSPVLLDRLRAYDNGKFDIPLHCADVLHHPPELDGQFDAVVGFFTLQHLHDLPRCFEAMTRLLKRGGCLVFLEPNPYNPLYYVQILLTPGMTWQGEKGMIQMRPALIFRGMEGAGLSRLAIRRFGFFPPFLANQRWGPGLEGALERVPVWRPFLPFQLFRGEKV